MWSHDNLSILVFIKLYNNTDQNDKNIHAPSPVITVKQLCK
jgi:hypothetical protein